MKQEKTEEVKRTGPPVQKAENTVDFSLSARVAQRLSLLLIALVPFHAFLTVFSASLGVNYTLARLWSAFVLLAVLGVAAYWAWRDTHLRAWLGSSYLMRVLGLFMVLQLAFGLRGVLLGQVSADAAFWGVWLNSRYVLFFAAMILLIRYSKVSLESVVKLVIGCGLVVAAFAVLQYTVLPADFLKHFGYGEATIMPYETINNNNEYLRVISTTRGANPLGAYMAIVIMLIIAFWRKLGHKLTATIMLSLGVCALLFSYSRSAWLGLFVGFVLFVGLQLRTKRHWRHFGLVALAVCTVAGVALFAFKDEPALQNALYHTEDNSKVAISSNDQRAEYISKAAGQVLREPLGRGVGSAGPASVHNSEAPARLAENYFLQIGQEAGWFGLFAYIALLLAVGFQLWRQRSSTFSLVLLATLIGLSFINLLSHAWTDDTLAFTWWGLAGLAIGDWVWRRQNQKAS